jgi:O-antigen/teichoic acid export membrane protein
MGIKIAGILELSTKARLLRGVSASLFDKGAITIVQLMSIPVLTSNWGVDGYGVWLMLLTIPTYIALSDFGLGTAASVEIAKAIDAKEFQEATAILQSTWSIVSAALATVGFLGLVAALLVLKMSNFELHLESRDYIPIAISMIIVYSITIAQMSILNAVFRATYKFAGVTWFSGTLALLEGGAILFVSAAGHGILMASIFVMLLRLAGFLLLYAVLRALEPWAKLGWMHANKSIVLRLIGPSLASFSLTLSNAIALQGAILSLGVCAGPGTVALFGAARTVTRLPLQISGMLLRPSLPELTRAHAQNNQKLISKIVNANLFVAVAVAVPSVLLFYFLGQIALSNLSNNNLHAPPVLFLVLSLAAMGSSIWLAIGSPLVSVNKQGTFSYWYLSLSTAVAITPFFFVDYYGLSVAVSMMIAEFLMVYLVLIVTRRVGEESK